MRLTLRTGAAMAVLCGMAGLAWGVGTPINLTNNFNGLVHNGESGLPDDPNGYRSISDRGLLIDGVFGSFGSGAMAGATGLTYLIEADAQALDVVFLGNRASGGHPYDLDIDGDNFGIRPNWDTTVNHLDPQVSDVSSQNIVLYPDSEIGFLYQISNGGGTFEALITFTDTTSVTVTIAGPDWYNLPVVGAAGAGLSNQSRLGGINWPATTGNDMALTGIVPTNNLSVFEAIVTPVEMIADGLGNHVGKTIQSITFQNGNYVGSTQRGYAIIAATAHGTPNGNPAGAASVTPNPAIYNTAAKVAVTVLPSTNLPNTITTVSVDGSSINAGTIALNDSGSGGDVTAGDGVWSADFMIPGNAPAGAASLPYTITDVQARQGTGFASFTIVAPPAATDVGSISGGAYSFQENINPGEVKWIKFNLTTDIDNGLANYLDIETEGSVITGAQFANDTYISLWNAVGDRVSFDDDDGTDYVSALSYGQTTPTRPQVGNGVAFNGRDGALTAGTYYLALSVFPNTFPALTNWNVATTHTGTGTIVVNFNLGPFSPCPADLDNDGDFSNGGSRDGGVDINDLLYFLTGFEAGSVLVDIDNGTGTGTPDGGTDINDLLFFLVRFEAGC